MEATKCLNLDWRRGKDTHSWWAFVCSEGVHKREIWIVVCGGDLKMALRKQSKVGSSKKPTTISKVGFGERVQIYLYEY